MSYEDWDKVLRVNLSGAFYMAKPALSTWSTAAPAGS